MVYCQDNVWPKSGRRSSRIPFLGHPDAHKHCGIHAYYKPMNYWVAQFPMRPFNRSVRRFAGAMVGWGWVAEHEAGFRAQYAQVIALQLMPDDNDLVHEAAERYGVLALERDELVKYCEWWGEVRCEGDLTEECKCEARCTCDEVLDNPTKED